MLLHSAASILWKPWAASLIKFYQDSRLQQERTYLANETTQQQNGLKW